MSKVSFDTRDGGILCQIHDWPVPRVGELVSLGDKTYKVDEVIHIPRQNMVSVTCSLFDGGAKNGPEFKNKVPGIEYDINKRWEKGMAHHPKSVALFKRIAEIDFHLCKDYFCWKSGGDGDNGETLMYEMDIFFEEQGKKEDK